MSKIILPLRVRAGKYNAVLAIKNRTISADRRVKHFELELPIEDGGTSYIDGETHPITKDLIICAKPGQTRHTHLPYKCFYIHMIVSEGLLYDTLINMPNFIEITNSDRIRNYFERICTCYIKDKKETELLQQGLILELIYAIHSPAQIGKAKSSNQAIEKAIRYIKSNLTSELSLEKVASEVKFAPSYFHRLFKASVGKPLHQYIEELRIERATNLLITTEMTLTEIAYECGFSSQSYFSYAFKRHTGMTPRAYAKKIVEVYDRNLPASVKE